MSLISNLGSYDSFNDIKEEDYNSITSIEINNINIIDELFANSIGKLINLKKINTTLCNTYNYLLKYIFFDIDICTKLYNYITDKKNIFNNNFNDKKSELMFRIKNINLNKNEDIISQFINLDKKIKPIILFFKNLTLLNIEEMEIDYFIEEFYNFTTLKKLKITNCNPILYLQNTKDINFILTNNKNIKSLVIAELKITNKKNMVLFRDDVLNKDPQYWKYFYDIIIEAYSEHNSNLRIPNCEICPLLFNIKELILNTNYFDEYIKLLNFPYCFDFNEPLIFNNNLELLKIGNLLYYKNKSSELKISFDIFNKTIEKTLNISSLPQNISKLIIKSENTINFENNLPFNLTEINICKKCSNNLDEIKHPFGLIIKKI